MPRVDWVPAEHGYEIALSKGRVVARNAAGAQLRAVPKPLKEGRAVAELKQLQEWLDRHELQCRAEVELWLVRSLPVPSAVVQAVWPDPAWHDSLRDLVVVPVAGDGSWELDRAGLLRDVDAGRGLGVVNLDGDSVWLTADAVVFPHPVLLADLEELREFAADLGVDQGTRQLFREIWLRPDDPDELEAAAAQYEGGRFLQLRHLLARTTSHGYAVRGGCATCRVWEDGRPALAAVWVGVDDPSQESETGRLTFSDGAGTSIALAEVGPVAWSEGLRMAAALYAGRVVEAEEPA
jgi:Domain of unknown function (DUF4132)